MAMKRNITIQLDETVINKARVVAARRLTSISRLVAQEIEKAANQMNDYQQAKASATAQMDNPFRFGNDKLPNRESLHER